MDVAVVWPGYAPEALAVGREGFAQPVDATVHTHVSFRLYSPTRTAGRVLFETCPRQGATTCEGGSPDFFVEPGWHTYVLRMDDVGGPHPWTGPVVALRLTVAGDGALQEMALDWFRVFRPAQPVAVSGGTGVVYWDADTDRGNNAPDSPDWGPVDGGVFPADAYPAGTYHFYADQGGYSAPVTVDGPVPVVLDPDLAGGPDYAEEVRGDAWDFDQPGDAGVGGVDRAEFRDGAVHGRNTPGPGDPYLELPLAGAIDAERYHRLTVTTAVDGPFDLSFEAGGGTHGRLLWTQVGQPSSVFRYDSKELVVYPGVRSYTLDLHTAPRDALIDETSSRGPGWAGQVDALRYDPNEDPAARSWTVDDIAAARRRRDGGRGLRNPLARREHRPDRRHHGRDLPR